MDSENNRERLEATLLEMARLRPRNVAEFLGINGVGQVKLARYGSAFLEAIAAAEMPDSAKGAKGDGGH